MPSDAGADEQALPVRLALHNLGKVGPERPADQAAGLVQYVVEIIRPEGELAELRKDGLLGQQCVAFAFLWACHGATTKHPTPSSWARKRRTVSAAPPPQITNSPCCCNDTLRH